MKPTKKHRADFVKDVLADVPTKNYPTQAEDLARKLYRAKCKELGVDKLNPDRLAHKGIFVNVYREDSTGIMFAALPADKQRWQYPQEPLVRIGCAGLLPHEIEEIVHCPEMMALRQGYAEECNMLLNLRKQLTATIDSCTTLKQAKEVLPEFIQYLPEEPTQVNRSLPVVGNLVADLSKAGWPKKKSQKK